MTTAQAKYLYMPQFSGHCNSIDDSSFALFCCDCLNTKFALLIFCDCLNTKFVRIMHIESTLGRIMGNISEKSILGSGLIKSQLSK